MTNSWTGIDGYSGKEHSLQERWGLFLGPGYLLRWKLSIMCSTFFTTNGFHSGANSIVCALIRHFYIGIRTSMVRARVSVFPKHKTRNQWGKRNSVPCTFNYVVEQPNQKTQWTPITCCKSCLYRSPTSTVLCGVCITKIRCFLCSDFKPTIILCYVIFHFLHSTFSVAYCLVFEFIFVREGPWHGSFLCKLPFLSITFIQELVWIFRS